MDPRTAPYIPYLDGWRGLAIVLLLIGHFFPVPGINLGTAGVNLFFVLSGFLMAGILFVRPVPIPVFYRRRIARVFPSVFVFIGAIVAVYAALGLPLSWNETAMAATFLNNYFPGKPAGAVMPFGHIWSLAVEEHSYVVLSLAALAARAGRGRARTMVGMLALACALFGVGYWLTYPTERLAFDRWLHTEVAAFGIFASAYLVLFFEGRNTPRLPWPVFCALPLLGLALHWWSVPAPVKLIGGVGLFALAINLLRGAPPLVHAALSPWPLRQMGTWSFSIYLWQQPFYLHVHHHGLPALAGLLIALAAGIASYYLLERPARQWLNRHWAPKPGTGAAAPPAGPGPAHGVASYAPMSSAPTTGRVAPEATCRYTAPGLSDTPEADVPGVDAAPITSALAVGRKS